jgi:hypothetical protein
MTPIARLFSGPLDIVGDVHGEAEALRDLLDRLGYGADGRHAQGRRLVFVGDLCDRGPDSPAVVETVMDLVNRGLAQCVLGNHELNVLRGSEKAGNGWFFPEDHDRRRGRFVDCTRASDEQRDRFRAFFATLPVALERPDLRVVHAAWHHESLESLGNGVDGTADQLYRHYQDRMEQYARSPALDARMRDEYRAWGRHLEDPDTEVPLLPAIARYDTLFQMSNPVRVVTSGVEAPAERSFYASGRWRMVERMPWWEDYDDPVPVVFGHYWRWYTPEVGSRFSRGERYLFGSAGPYTLLGRARNAICVDFSVGVRDRERPRPDGQPWAGRLAALRWPERELVFDDGERGPLETPVS